jgi:glycosyltransferase involved in cell wall biosynthesis
VEGTDPSCIDKHIVMKMRILFALPGFHRYYRGAEVALSSIANEIAALGDAVTLIGSGTSENSTEYRFLRAGSIRREQFEKFPSVPVLRNEFCYEELTFAPALLCNYKPQHYDITVTCSYPFTNWVLRRPVLRGARPRHIFVTQNGDWPAFASATGKSRSEDRFFGCDGLVCINPDFFERNKEYWNCRLIPNGVDCDRFQPGPARREEFGIPENRLVVLMVSALAASKRVEVGIEAVSRIPDAHLVVAGDGPCRNTIASVAAELLPGRFTRLSIASEKMPAVYHSSDVLLHCSKDEPFGNVFAEAMACGLPIVAHDMLRVRWIVGDDEFLVDTDEVAAVAKAIQRAGRSGSDGRQRRINRAKNFSWKKIGMEYRQFFGEIIAGANSRQPTRH